MQIDEKLLSKLEKLSALKIADEKRKQIISQLSQIIEFVERLNELDLNAQEITINTISGGTPFRKDESEKSDVINQIFEHSPKCEDGFFLVPKIIE